MQSEVWKDIPEYEGVYQVSDQGVVKSLGNEFNRKEKLLKHGSASGYNSVTLSKDKNKRMFYIHQLVAMAFLGHKRCGHKLVIDHINNVKTDNRLVNLNITTQRINASKDRKGYTSKYVGVHLCKISNRWGASIWNSEAKKKKWLGHFDKEVDAHNAYQSELSNYQT